MWNVAQVNVGRMRGISLEDPIMRGFAEKLDAINLMAEQHEGFVWRLKDDGGNASAIRFDPDDRILINMSVWRDVGTLQKFVYKTSHREMLANRREWFENLQDIAGGIWYVPRFSFPSLEDARFRLNFLRKNGPTPLCFTFSSKFSLAEYITFMDQQKSNIEPQVHDHT